MHFYANTISVIMLNAKGKNVANYTQTQLKVGIRTFYAIQKEVRSMQKKKTAKL